MAEQFANHPGTTLAADISTTTRPVTFTVASADNLPTSGNFRVLIDSEILLITDISGTSLTGSNTENTVAAEHASGAAVTHILTAGALTTLKSDILSSSGAWNRVTIQYSSLTSSGTTQSVDVTALNARTCVMGMVIKHTVQFAGASLTALKMTIGDSLSTAGFYAALPYDLLAAVSDTTFHTVFSGPQLSSFDGSTVQANFVAEGAGLNALTAGSVDIDIYTVTLP